MKDYGAVIVKRHKDAVIGSDFSFDDATGEIIRWNVEKLGPKPGSVYDIQFGAEELAVAKEQKQLELEAAFQNVWNTQFGGQVAVGLVLYVEFPNDPRTVAVKNARTNFINKTNALNNLGKPGNAPLTEANIASIVW